MFKKYKISKNKEKGFTLVEIMISSSLLLMIMIGMFNVLNKHNQQDRLDEIAYTTAVQMYNMSEIARAYIDNNIEDSLPSAFDMSTLRNEGYVSDEVKDIHILPFGRELKFYANNDYGFTLSVGMIATGDMDYDLLNLYSMNNEFNKISYEQRVATYLSEMVKDKDYNIGIINSDYNMKWLTSNEYFDLEPFIKKSTTDVFEGYSTSLFFNLQENPGYFVMNYISSAYQDKDIAETSSHSSLHTIGYSDFCPNPYIKIDANPFGNTLSGVELQSGGDGDLYSNIYVCIPSSKINLEDHVSVEIPLVNQFHRDISYKDTCYIWSNRANIVEFRLRNNYYTMQTSSGRVDLRCYRGFVPTYQFFKLNTDSYSGATSDLILNFSGSYTARIPNVSINKVNLNSL